MIADALCDWDAGKRQVLTPIPRTIDRANQVWALDTTYMPMARGFVYLTAVIDWA